MKYNETSKTGTGKIIRYSVLLSLSLTLFSCHNSENDWDASGAFESVETIISTEASGTLMQFDIEEGQTKKKGDWIGYVDSAQLYFRKKQLEAQIVSTISQVPDIPVQVASLYAQLSNADINQKRIERLFKGNAATQQQLDDANTQVEIIKKQIEAQKSTLGITAATLEKQVAPLQRQIDQVDDQIDKCRIINPVSGTVLTKYAENHEVVTPGKALYKIAPTDTLILRAYITGNQLDMIKLGQAVKVRTDLEENKYRTYNGVIYWISDKAEFTPKTIPTKDERAELVYAIKVRVPNDGYIKIGMYGDLKFN
ncbi:MAG: HlyD family efflux transporter periplasmic adaptor subunit [Bacteroidia bacterium]|jgi:HlyD family secretion protein|nr:HlyD family efflux transporter periplasmic adaptor subunit [Bacteroidia bacterium]